VEGSCMALIGHHDRIVSLEAIVLDKTPLLALEYCRYGEMFDCKSNLFSNLAILTHLLTRLLSRLSSCQSGITCS